MVEESVGAISHPLVDLVPIEPPVGANSESWNLALTKKLINSTRIHSKIFSQLFCGHNDDWSV